MPASASESLPAPRARGASRADPRSEAARRADARLTLLGAIRHLPAYLRLLGGLLLDRRVSCFDKALVAGAIAYVVSPIDLIPDFIPFLGEVDDIFVLMLALQHLVSHAGEDVVRDHWHGDPAELDYLNVKEVLSAAVVFLPGSVRSRLFRLVREAARRPARRDRAGRGLPWRRGE